MPRIKIFNVYHKPCKIFKSDCIEPIQVGCANSRYDLGIWRDDTGENISRKNGGYCELTAQYWVWKNYILLNPGIEYIGFCHYRRYMDFWDRNDTNATSFFNYRYMGLEEFESSIFNKCFETEILSTLSNNIDIVLPESYHDTRPFASILNLYKLSFGGYGIHECLDVIKSDFPDWIEDFYTSMKSKSAYHCLTFLMRRELFKRYAEWMFSFLSKVEEKIKGKSFYNPSGRLEGYLGELFFNMWLHHEIRVNNITISECGGIFLDSPILDNKQKDWRKFYRQIIEILAWIKAEIWSRNLFRKI